MSKKVKKTKPAPWRDQPTMGSGNDFVMAVSGLIQETKETKKEEKDFLGVETKILDVKEVVQKANKSRS